MGGVLDDLVLASYSGKERAEQQSFHAEAGNILSGQRVKLRL